jgi:thiamine biosynthesis lipoprotein ApbE
MRNQATEADAMATAFNVIGYPDALNIANNNNIALMLGYWFRRWVRANFF